MTAIIQDSVLIRKEQIPADIKDCFEPAECGSCYVCKLIAVFREVRRVLRADGTCFIVIGDSFRNKQLQGIPWRLAFALQDDGWWLRSECIWAKVNAMPESVRDRFARSHEQVFMLTKSQRYFFDSVAVAEPAANGGCDNATATRNARSVWTLSSEAFSGQHYASYPTKLVTTCIKAGTSERGVCQHCGAQHVRVVERNVTAPSSRPTNKPIRYLAASAAGQGTNGTGESSLGMVGQTVTTGFRQSCSCPPADPIPATVLDCFAGSGTTGLVADRMQRNATLIDISDDYKKMARERITDDAPLFAQVT